MFGRGLSEPSGERSSDQSDRRSDCRIDSAQCVWRETSATQTRRASDSIELPASDGYHSKKTPKSRARHHRTSHGDTWSARQCQHHHREARHAGALRLRGHGRGDVGAATNHAQCRVCASRAASMSTGKFVWRHKWRRRRRWRIPAASAARLWS